MDSVFGDVIHRYSRAEALADAVVVDVSPDAAKAGIKFPVAVTQRVWYEIVVPDDLARSLGEDERGRLWDLVWMLRVAIGLQQSAGDRILYHLYVTRGRQRRLVTLKAVCGPGDEAEPVITISFPEED